jgi:hypothetical protein
VLAKELKFVKIKTHMKSIFLLTVLLFSGCGYTLRGNTRPFFEKNGIHNLYVEPVKNDSYKAGVEITVYNALRKRIALGGYVRLVDKESQSDAKFSATVTDASYSPAAITTGDTIPTGDPAHPFNTDLGNVQIAKSYNVILKVKFILKGAHPDKILWADELTRSNSFPATIYLGPTGSTSALINESVYERQLEDLSANIVTDAEESINTIF